MSFGHCVYGNGSTLFGKDVWDPQGFLFILQQGKFRFFGAKGKESGEAWNLIAKDETEERDYRFTLFNGGSDPSVYALLYMLDSGAANVIDYATV